MSCDPERDPNSAPVTQRQKAVTAAVAEIPGQVHDLTLESRFVLTVVKHVLRSSAP